MPKISLKILLERAEQVFLQGDFDNALCSYGLILRDYTDADEARVGVYLSDLGLESGEEAQALFDYYLMIKDKNEDPVATIDNLIKSLDDSKHHIQAMLHPHIEQVEYVDGIVYSDFLDLVKDKGNFRETFENIMFSTSVVITNKDDFMDFVTKLSNDNFDEMALRYLDASMQLFGNDQDILALYDVVRKNSSETRV